MTFAIRKRLFALSGDLRGFGRGEIRRAAAANALLAPGDLAALQARALAERISAAVRDFPDYARKVRAAGISPGDLLNISPERAPGALPLLPVWTREDQNRLYAALGGPPLPGAIAHATGGSTGQPTRFYMTRESFEWRRAVSDRGYSWAGAEPGRRVFFVWGALIEAPRGAARLAAYAARKIENRFFFDSFRFNREDMEACCRAIEKFRPAALVGYAGNLVRLARYARDNPGKPRFRPRAVVTAAEGLQPGQRELLQAHLGGEVFMSYGSREFMLIGMECRVHQGYHISGDNLFVEVADAAGHPLPPGETGNILVTDLRNGANPFVRYAIGDVGAMAAGNCSCGLPFPLLARVEGRSQEWIEKADGSRATALFLPHLMKEFEAVEGYQVLQTAPGCLTLNMMSRHPLEGGLREAIALKLSDFMGPGSRIELRRTDRLERTHTGKTPIVIKHTHQGVDARSPTTA